MRLRWILSIWGYQSLRTYHSEPITQNMTESTCFADFQKDRNIIVI